MRILDEQDQEMQLEDCDLNLGYLTADKHFVQHHEAQEAVAEQGHYYPKTFYFMDGSQYDVTTENEDDPNVIPNEDGVSFDLIRAESAEDKTIKGCDVRYIIDVEKQDAKEAYDEYEDIERYIRYTEDELRGMAIEQAAAQRQELISVQSIALMNYMVQPMSLEMTDEQVQAFDMIMPDFEAGQSYENKAVVRYKGALYRAIQAVDSSVTQTYTPDQANSYWKRIGEPNEEGVYPWSQPYGATDCYQIGDKVTYQGKTYESIIANNVWSPTAYPAGWKEISAETTKPEQGGGTSSDGGQDTYEGWKQPTGGHDAYNVGDRVTFEGKVYESLINANTWSPSAYPAGWKEIVE